MASPRTNLAAKAPKRACYPLTCQFLLTKLDLCGKNHVPYPLNSGKRTRSVGEKLPNAFGLYDMSGNVWEWCKDWYEKGHAPSARDPQGPTSGNKRIIRGASWWNDSGNCKSANRYMQPPELACVLGGARLICRITSDGFRMKRSRRSGASRGRRRTSGR